MCNVDCLIMTSTDFEFIGRRLGDRIKKQPLMAIIICMMSAAVIIHILTCSAERQGFPG